MTRTVTDTVTQAPPVYQPPDGVYGPVLGRDVPEGWEWQDVGCEPPTVDVDVWETGDAPRRPVYSGDLHWCRPVPEETVTIVLPRSVAERFAEVHVGPVGRAIAKALAR